MRNSTFSILMWCASFSISALLLRFRCSLTNRSTGFLFSSRVDSLLDLKKLSHHVILAILFFFMGSNVLLAKTGPFDAIEQRSEEVTPSRYLMNMMNWIETDDISLNNEQKDLLKDIGKLFSRGIIKYEVFDKYLGTEGVPDTPNLGRVFVRKIYDAFPTNEKDPYEDRHYHTADQVSRIEENRNGVDYDKNGKVIHKTRYRTYKFRENASLDNRFMQEFTKRVYASMINWVSEKAADAVDDLIDSEDRSSLDYMLKKGYELPLADVKANQNYVIGKRIEATWDDHLRNLLIQIGDIATMTTVSLVTQSTLNQINKSNGKNVFETKPYKHIALDGTVDLYESPYHFRDTLKYRLANAAIQRTLYTIRHHIYDYVSPSKMLPYPVAITKIDNVYYFVHQKQYTPEQLAAIVALNQYGWADLQKVDVKNIRVQLVYTEQSTKEKVRKYVENFTFSMAHLLVDTAIEFAIDKYVLGDGKEYSDKYLWQKAFSASLFVEHLSRNATVSAAMTLKTAALNSAKYYFAKWFTNEEREIKPIGIARLGDNRFYYIYVVKS